MRELGLCVTSAGSIRIVKRHVARLGLDTSHFTGQRRWSDAQLRRAVASAYSWPELRRSWGLPMTARTIALGSRRTLRGSASTWADSTGSVKGAGARPEFKPDIKHLREAGTAIAAMWFLLCGYNTSLPMEPTLYRPAGVHAGRDQARSGQDHHA